MPRWFGTDNTPVWEDLNMPRQEYIDRVTDVETVYNPEITRELLFYEHPVVEYLDILSNVFILILLFRLIVVGEEMEGKHVVFLCTMLLKLFVPQLAIVTGVVSVWQFARIIGIITGITDKFDTWKANNLNKRADLEKELELL
jgi:hypothetical protein